MVDAVFHDRLKNKLGDFHLDQQHIDLKTVVKHIPKPDLLCGKISVYISQLLLDRNKLVLIVGAGPEQAIERAHRCDYILCASVRSQPLDIVEGIINEMRINLVLQHIQFRFPLLIIELVDLGQAVRKLLRAAAVRIAQPPDLIFPVQISFGTGWQIRIADFIHKLLQRVGHKPL